MPGIYSNEEMWLNTEPAFNTIQSRNDRSTYGTNRSLYDTNRYPNTNLRQGTNRSQHEMERNGTSSRSIYKTESFGNNRPAYGTERFGTNRSVIGPDRFSTSRSNFGMQGTNTNRPIYGNLNNLGSSLKRSQLQKRSRSYTDLYNADRGPSSHLHSSLVQADPELKDAEKSGTDYHITLNLPSNLLTGTHNENVNKNYNETINVEERRKLESVAVLERESNRELDDNVFQTLRLNGPPQKSVVTVKTNEPMQIFTKQENIETKIVQKPVTTTNQVATINKVVKTATVNVNEVKRTSRFPVDVRGHHMEVRGGFVVKSIVPSAVKNDVGFDLFLTGGETKQVVESRSLPRPIPPVQEIEERKVRRIIYEQPIVIERTTRRIRHESPEPIREKKIRVKKVKKTQVREPVKETKIVPIREVIREPEVRQARQELPDVVEKREEVKETRVEIPILEVAKPLPVKQPVKKKEKSTDCDSALIPLHCVHG